VRLSLRARLLGIVAAAGLGFVLPFVASQLSSGRVEQKLQRIEGHDIPRLELGFRLSQDFERVQRGFLDAVAAHDLDALGLAERARQDFLRDLESAAGAIDPDDARNLRESFESYWRRAQDVSRRLIASETGEQMIARMGQMQDEQGKVREIIRRAAAVNRRELSQAFADARRAHLDGRRFDLLATGISLIVIAALSVTLGRGVIRSFGELRAGLGRFGRGQFHPPIEVHGDDEIAALAGEANRMAESLAALAREREAHAARLREKAEELERVSAYKSQFLANTSHELRTPLNSMLLLSGLLVENESGNLSPRQVEFAHTMHSAGRELLGLIDQILDLARVESGHPNLQIGSVNVVSVVQRIEQVFGPLARQKNLVLSTSIDRGTPAVIQTDRQKLDQILSNLVGNAIKFTPVGEVRLRVGSGESGRIVFEVTDTGIGIAREHQARIYEPFEQVESASNRRFGGTGLGLTIARQLTELLGGELQLSSEPGKGSSFRCVLPLGARAASAGGGEGPEAAPPRPAPSRLWGRQILIVDDDPRSLDALGAVLRARGVEVRSASSGPEALALLSADPAVELVLLDMMMPEMDGEQVLGRLRADPRWRSLPVVAVTARALPADAEQVLRAGANAHLPKPVEVDRLVSLIDALLPSSPREVA